MTRGDKSKYTDKQKRKAEHIEEGYEERGVSHREAEKRAWATVNKQDHGGKKGGRLSRGSAPIVPIVILAVIVAGIAFIAVRTTQSRARFEDVSLEAQAATTTPKDTVPAAAAPKKEVSTPTPAAAPKSTISSSTVMVQTNAPLCTANDLTGMAALQGASGSLAGTLTVTNSSKRPCAFSHDVTLQILSGSTVLPVVQLQNVSAGSIADLQPGDSVDLRFMWSNWCRAALSAPGAVRLVLASSGYLKVPFIASSGAPQYDSPRCDSQSLQSYVTIR